MARTVLRIGGADRAHFLQGLVTNDVGRLGDGLVYAALLTPQGKYLADFFLKDDGDSILLDADAAQAPGLAQRLAMYRLRAAVTIGDSGLRVRRGTGPAPDGALPDPRHPDLGWRLYGAEGGDDGTDFDAIRVALCIPEAGIELIPNETFVLEAGFERLRGVDFRKGCYVGQEVTARMKHKTDLRKGLATVEIDGDADPGTPLLTEEGKEAGTLHTRSGGRAIAYLRFDRAEGPLRAGQATVRLAAPAAAS
jgi:folate-binding protein YgfZ